MKIAVIGAGGVGGYFGGLLAKAGNDVTFVARGEHGRVLKEKGLIVKSVAGDFSVNPVKVVESVTQLTHPDLIIFTVKTYDTDLVAQQLNSVINDDTIVITFQNGVENDLRIKQNLIKGKIYPGVCYIISARTKSGVIEQTGGLRRLIFGDRENAATAQLQNIETLMKKASIDAVFSDDITRDIWKKFIFLTAFSGMTALTRQPIGNIVGDPKLLEQYAAVVKESIAVAKALHVNLPTDIFDSTMKTSTNTVATAKSSLLLDIENGRKNEIETINGALVRLAHQVNVLVPINEMILTKINQETTS